MPATAGVFVSHASEDNAFTRKLVADLKTAGADVWVDFDNIREGDFVQRINEGFVGRQWFVIVLSPAALKSPWVPREMNAAMSLASQGRLRGIVGIVAEEFKKADLPSLWVNYQHYDATYDYARALQNVLSIIGLSDTVPQTSAHLVVDPQREGGYKSLAEALAAAQPGDEIEVHPAVYTETLTFTKPVHLIGQGKPEEIIIAPQNEKGVYIRADRVRFTNLSVWIGAPKDVTDLVEQNRKDVTGVTLGLAAGGLVLGAFVLAAFNPLWALGMGGMGLYRLYKEYMDGLEKPAGAVMAVAESASLELRNCIVRNSLGAGLDVYGQATVASSRIFACWFDAIYIGANGSAAIEDSELVANRTNGVQVNGSVTMRRNKVTGNRKYAILVGDSAKGVFYDNILSGNKRSAWKGSAAALANMKGERNAQ